MPQAMKIPAVKAAVDKEWEKLEKIPAWDITKVRNKSEVIDEATTKGIKFILPHWWTSVIWRMPNWRQSTKNIKVELYFEATLWKMILDLMQYFQNKDHQHHKWRRQRSWTSYPDCQGAQDKHLTQYLLKPGQNERCSKIIEIPKSECPDMWIRLPRHKWPKSWSSMEDPVVLLERNLYGHPLAGLLWERQFEKILLKYGWEKHSNRECLFVHRDFFFCVCGWHQIGWKETKYQSDVESTEQRSWFERTNIIPWPCIPGMYSKTKWNKQRYCWQLQNHVWVQNFRRSNRKITMLGKSEHLFMVLWHGKVMPRNVWNDNVSWQTRRLNNSTKYQLHALTTIISKKKNWNPWENCQRYVLKLFWNACTWHVLDDPIFCGQWTNLRDRSQNEPKRVTNDYLVWSLTFIILVITNNIVMWETLQNNADWDCFKTPILQEILRNQNLHQLEHCAFSEVFTFVPISWMYKKQTSVSHSSTESEIISLDAR